MIDCTATDTPAAYTNFNELFRVVIKMKPHVTARAAYGLPEI
jgi:hypothetical protein